MSRRQSTVLVRVVAAVAVIANLAALIQFGADHPWLYAALAAVIVLAIAAVVFPKLYAFFELRNILSEAEESLRGEKWSPERLIAFDRSSAVFAGMLAQRMGIGELIALPRSAEPATDLAPRSVSVGSGAKLALDSDALGRSLVVVFHLRTGATLEAGLKAARPLGGGEPMGVLAFYATDGGLARWPGVKVVRRVRSGEVPNETLPWISGAYSHE